MVQIKSLRKSDFDRDPFNIFIGNYIETKHLRSILLAYRLAKYAQLNADLNIKRPAIAASILLTKLFPILIHKRSQMYNAVTTLFVHYIIKQSYFLTADDVAVLFSLHITENNLLLFDLSKILESKAIITRPKLKKYQQKFSKMLIAIKAAEVIANLKTIDVEKEQSYLKKVHKRYRKIFQIYPEIDKYVSSELKKCVCKLVRSNNLTHSSQSDLINYYVILK